MKIIAPVDVTGVYASVMFVNGVGETENPVLIEWFSTHGYKLEDNKEPIVEEPFVLEINITDDELEAMTPNELRDWMKENGLGKELKNIRSKTKLIEIIKSYRG